MIAMTLIFLNIGIIPFALMCCPLTAVTHTLLLLDDRFARGFYIIPWLSLHFKITTRSFTLRWRKIIEFHTWAACMRKLSERAYKTSLGAHFAAAVVAKITAADLGIMLLLCWYIFRFLLRFGTRYVSVSVFGWMYHDCLCLWWLGIFFLFLVDRAR